MTKLLKFLIRRLIPLSLVASCTVAAASQEIDDAVKRYYAGFPEQAIGMLKPLAEEGNVDAQYLLGNIMYSLSGTGKYRLIDESVKWYKMAAEQNVADSNYALGVIFQNKWVESRSKKDAATAIVYYQKAVDLGYSKARTYLAKMKSRSGISQQEALALVKDHQVKSSLDAESGIETPEKPIASLDSETEVVSIAGSARIDNAKTGTAAEPGTKTETSDPSAQITEDPDDEGSHTVALADLARQCHNYTEAGFTLYAQTIKDALVTGNASIAAMSPDPSKPGTYSIDLINRQFDSAVFVELGEVPEEIAKLFDEGEAFKITGVIIDSRLVGSNCAISIRYQSNIG